MTNPLGNHLWPIAAKPQQYPACLAMTPTTTALWAITQAARARQIANPASPEHWLHHIDPVTLERSDCECEVAR